MTSRTAVNLALLAAVAVLSAVAYLLPAGKHEPSPPALTRLSPDRITRVTISPKDGQQIVLVRRGGHWRLAAPIRTAANGFLINSLVGLAAADSFRHFPVRGRDLREYGLDHPPVRLRLNDLEIDFGGSEPLHGRRYVRVGDTVHVIPGYFYQDVSGGVADFVSLNLLPEGSDPVQLALPDLTLRRDAEGHWAVAGKKHPPQGMEDLVTRWRRAQALQVERYSGSGHHGTVTVTFDKGHAPLTFDIVSTKPELVLARPDIGMAYHFPESQTDKLLHLPGPGDARHGPPPARPH